MWTLKKALKLIRQLQPKIRKCGYHIALGGGVLNKSKSKNDLDLILLIDDQKEQKLKLAIKTFVGYTESNWRSFGYVTKVELYNKDKTRIDLLIPNKFYYKS